MLVCLAVLASLNRCLYSTIHIRLGGSEREIYIFGALYADTNTTYWLLRHKAKGKKKAP